MKLYKTLLVFLLIFIFVLACSYFISPEIKGSKIIGQDISKNATELTFQYIYIDKSIHIDEPDIVKQLCEIIENCRFQRMDSGFVGGSLMEIVTPTKTISIVLAPRFLRYDGVDYEVCGDTNLSGLFEIFDDY